MITKAQAVAARYRQEFWTIDNNGGRVIKVRVTGKCNVWKKDLARFHMPVKYGLYESHYIDNMNAERFYMTKDEATEALSLKQAAYRAIRAQYDNV